jgi:hypothetical protein
MFDEAETAPTTDVTIQSGASLWDAAFQALRSRFPKAKDSILFCIHALQQDSNVLLAKLKGLALMHGIRITGGSLAAARRQIEPKVGKPVARRQPQGLESTRVIAQVALVAKPEPASHVQARTLPKATADLGEMLLQVVGRATVEADAKAERLREAVRRAIEVLRGAVE